MKNGSNTLIQQLSLLSCELVGGGEDTYMVPPPTIPPKQALNIQGVIVAGDGHGNVGYAVTAALPVSPYVNIEAGINGVNGMHNKMIGVQAYIPFK